MQLHEPIDVGCEPIDTILHYGESLVHLLTEITKFKVDEPKLLIYLPESRIYLAESFVYLPESCIYLAESFVYLPESCIRLPEAASNKFFEGGELLIDGSRFLCRFFYCHLFFLAAANWTESQDEILANRLIADEIDIPRFFPAASRLLNHLIRPRSDFGSFGGVHPERSRRAQYRFSISDCRTRVGADLRVGPPNGRTPFDSAQGRRRSAPTLACCFLYRITLFARTSTFGGIVRPICFAAFRLTTNSNRIGCSTGRSVGFLPFRILST